MPGLLRLSLHGLLPEYRVIGTSLDALDDDGFRAFALDACREFVRDGPFDEHWPAFVDRLRFVPQSDGPAALAAAVKQAEDDLGGEPRRLHYLSVPPVAARGVVESLDRAGLTDRARVIMEKPFGTDLQSARALNRVVRRTFDEDQVFRIDHFLGKEAAQNILAFRFANGLFEPIWNRQHIDHVQIDVPETLLVGSRAAFYESTGAFRDMVVTHLFQILAFVAMEPPTALESAAINEEKNKVFRSMRPLDVDQVVRGQYDGYRSTPGVDPASDTETFVALRCEIDNWRWGGVPFYLRTGKGMAEGARIVSIAFREPPKSMFPPGSGVGALGPDHLTFDLADAARLSLSFYGKRPGPGMRLDKLSLQFAVQETEHGGDVLEAYERLHPRRHDRRPDALPERRRHRTALGGLPAAARRPAPGRAVPARFVGPAGHGRARRPAPLAAAVRARLAPCELSPTTDEGPAGAAPTNTGPAPLVGQRWSG